MVHYGSIDPCPGGSTPIYECADCCSRYEEVIQECEDCGSKTILNLCVPRD